MACELVFCEIVPADSAGNVDNSFQIYTIPHNSPPIMQNNFLQSFQQVVNSAIGLKTNVLLEWELSGVCSCYIEVLRVVFLSPESCFCTEKL